MREIKFRGKRPNSGKWITGGLVKNGMYSHVLGNGHLEVECSTEVLTETVGQYIGLKDKNGKEIYEGDIVRWDDMSNGKYWRIAVVLINPDIQFDCSLTKVQENAASNHCFKYGNFIYKRTDLHLEIIGNVHENKELL